MNDLPKSQGKGTFSIGNWQEIRKAGGESPPPIEISKYLRDTQTKLTRGELIERIEHFFDGCIHRYVDEETGETGYSWKKNPTKSELAMCIGVSAATLSRYLAGKYDGRPYNGVDVARCARVSPDDFDVIRSAATVIESFYESRLGVNMNNAGSIFWLKNRDNSNWHDSMDMSLSTQAKQDDIPQMSREEIAARYRAQEEFREKPQLPEGID